MKLWLLKPKDDLPDKDNPWEPWYDKCFGFVIRAETEELARQIANQNAGNENRSIFLSEYIPNTLTPWIDNNYSNCEELQSVGEEKLIIRDMHYA